MNRLSDLLSTLFERRYAAARTRDDRPLKELCGDLMTSRGEVSGGVLARLIMDRYAALDDQEKRDVFRFLSAEMDVDVDAVVTAATAYRDAPGKATFRHLMTVSEPSRQELARRLNQVPGATARLVAMRTDLLRFAADDPSLANVDLDFRHLFASWFNRGFLVLRPINWESPAVILEKIIAYEAVHAIDSWEDLRRRLQPSDRRCFAFFHPAMPDEPLIFVEVALTKGTPNSIQNLLAEGRESISEMDADTAVFYSISNCQEGLAGISFGNSLIKQVVEDLSRYLPHLRTFVTLSPIPGLRAWLEEEDMLDRIDAPEDLRALTAQYLLNAKRANGLPRDPVARFHLNNGALVHDVHAGADLSDNGIAQSGGAMVNYLYDLSRIAQNHETFATDQTVVAARTVQSLARNAPVDKKERSAVNG